MFPNSDDTPAEFAQLTIHAAIACFIVGKFLFPEGPVAGRRLAVLGATVPETTVNENGDTSCVEHEVRFPENRLVAPPAGDMMPAEEFHQGDFRVLIAVSTNAGHDLRAFGLGENVGHGQPSEYASSSNADMKPRSRASGVPTTIARSRP